jgi:hypothetical protein
MSEQLTAPSQYSLRPGLAVGALVVAAFASNIHNERYETYVLADGRRFRSHNDGPFVELAPVPGTVAAAPRPISQIIQSSADAIRVEVIPGSEPIGTPAVDVTAPVTESSSTEPVRSEPVSSEPVSSEPASTDPASSEPAPVIDPPTEANG